ncbi:MAG: hypothetical protein AM326_04000 [Candidatus Thorarchaeota archaeon SMTZ-45]|nr:MAG: hypothetical protein AM326_04000 [Candidatus Thorarchaeota archaeon SMTZ-45]KXH75099.1 MAG: hypothetical protein AM325_04920 [Candidatus Thorarchaeota archaeon SMTZ1-45]
MGWKEILQVTLFILAWIPVGILAGSTLIGAEGTYNYDFSIYNEQYNGTSQFASNIQNNGYDVMSIQASMSVASRYNGSAVIVIMGPVRDFTIDAALVIFTHLMAGGGVLIADDFGSANMSLALLNFLLDQFIPDNTTRGLLSFIDGVLLDLDSYDPQKEPRLPIIRDFRAGLDGGALTAGVSELHLNWASAINPYCLLGLSGIAWTTPSSWCETNITDPTPEPDTPYELSLFGSLPVVGAIDLAGPGGSGGGRLVAVSDPSIFNNDMLGRFSGNERFGDNVINWLSHGNTSQPILFCEQLLEIPWWESEFFFGLYLGRILWLSSLPLGLSAVYPLFTTLGIKKYLPDIKKPEVKSVSDVFLRKGQTYFSERMTYYRTEGNYTRVVKMLYRRLRRGIRKTQQWTEYDTKRVWEIMRYKDSKLKESEFFKTITRIEEISSDPNIKIKENEMMELFFFMRNIQSHMIDTKKR